MTTRQPTCEERITEQLAGRLADFNAYRVDDTRDEGNDELPPINEYGLEVAEAKVYDVLLSYGGPEDHFQVTVDKDGDISRIVYIFKDWGDRAERVLHGPEFDTAAQFFTDYLALDA